MKVLKNAINVLVEIENDTTLSKNAREKIKEIIATLKEEKDISIKVNKTLNDLDEIANTPTIPSYTRMQIWKAVSLLETI